MPDETTVETTTTTTETDATAAATAAAQAASDAEALELGKMLQSSGFAKDKINDLLQAPAALDSIRYLVRENPKEFVTMLERSDPQAAENFKEQLASLYLEQKQHLLDKDDKGEGGNKDDKTGTLLQEIRELREKTTRLETKEQRREADVALASAKSRYDARVNEIMESDGFKALGLTKSEARAMRADLDQQLAKDQGTVQRISSGNFIDVPKVFKGIIEEWGNDKKAAAEAVKAKREGVKANAFPEFSPGAESFMPKDQNFTNSWDETEDAFAKALEKFQ